ncbi:hypothetical protein [Lactococcus sp. DD01]|uniref:hypothetical protein n=1 Tax=Lactococcus sp. DD01 TaxID=1776443 RepID=UPI0007761E1A|nr:hypothetical protein [Lactococcus sp. DD01]KXT62319.1 hypothetical protein LACDD01_00831 [Lactococcus sp. DD01]
MKRKNLLKQASKKFVTNDNDESKSNPTIIFTHDYSVTRGNKEFSFKNITTQKQWDEAKRKAGLGSKPFEYVITLAFGCDTKEEDERVEKLLDRLIL